MSNNELSPVDLEKAGKLLEADWQVVDDEVWTHESYPDDTFALDEAYDLQFPTINPEDLDQL